MGSIKIRFRQICIRYASLLGTMPIDGIVRFTTSSAFVCFVFGGRLEGTKTSNDPK